MQISVFDKPRNTVPTPCHESQIHWSTTYSRCQSPDNNLSKLFFPGETKKTKEEDDARYYVRIPLVEFTLTYIETPRFLQNDLLYFFKITFN